MRTRGWGSLQPLEAKLTVTTSYKHRRNGYFNQIWKINRLSSSLSFAFHCVHHFLSHTKYRISNKEPKCCNQQKHKQLWSELQHLGYMCASGSILSSCDIMCVLTSALISLLQNYNNTPGLHKMARTWDSCSYVFTFFCSWMESCDVLHIWWLFIPLLN